MGWEKRKEEEEGVTHLIGRPRRARHTTTLRPFSLRHGRSTYVVCVAASHAMPHGIGMGHTQLASPVWAAAKARALKTINVDGGDAFSPKLV